MTKYYFVVIFTATVDIQLGEAGEVVASALDGVEQWEEVEAGLTAAGIDLNQFYGRDGSVQRFSSLAGPAVRLWQRDSRALNTSPERVTQFWFSSINRLFDQVEELRPLVSANASNVRLLGVAVPNPYFPPVSTIQTEHGKITTWPFSDEDRYPYRFWSRGRCIYNPTLSLTKASLILKYDA